MARTLPLVAVWCAAISVLAEQALTRPVEGQPLAANVARLVEALDYLGAPLPAELGEQLAAAGRERDAAKLQQLLDGRVPLVVSINPESRVRVSRGPGAAVLQQGGYTPVL